MSKKINGAFTTGNQLKATSRQPNRRKFILSALATPIILTACSSREAIQGVGGSTGIPFINRASSAFKHAAPGFRVSYAGSGSTAGEKATMNGTADFGLIAREVSAEASAHVNVVPFLEDGIAIVASADTEINDIRLKDLSALFDMRQTPIGDAPYTRVGKAFGHGTRNGMATAIGVPPEALAAERMAGANAEVLLVLEAERNALGYVSAPIAEAAIRRGAALRLVAVDGHLPSRTNMANGSYPLRRQISLIFSKVGSSVGTRMFATFAVSDQGREIANDLEFSPISGAAELVSRLPGKSSARKS